MLDNTGNIPTFILNLGDDVDYDDVSTYLSQTYPDSPIFFFVHGFSVQPNDFEDGIRDTGLWFSNEMDAPVGSNQPVIIGVQWLAGKNFLVDNGRIAKWNIPRAAKKLEMVLSSLGAVHSGRINIVGHSYGTELVMDAIQDANTIVDAIVLVQGSTDTRRFSQNGQYSIDGILPISGRYSEVMGSGLIDNLIVTYSDEDDVPAWNNLIHLGGVDPIGTSGLPDEIISQFDVSVINCDLNLVRSETQSPHHSYSPARSLGVASIITSLIRSQSTGDPFVCPDSRSSSD